MAKAKLQIEVIRRLPEAQTDIADRMPKLQ